MPSTVKCTPWLLRAFWRRGTSPLESPRLRGAWSGCGATKGLPAEEMSVLSLASPGDAKISAKARETNASAFMGAVPVKTPQKSRRESQRDLARATAGATVTCPASEWSREESSSHNSSGALCAWAKLEERSLLG